MKRGDRVTEREQTPVEKLAEVLKVHGGVGKSIGVLMRHPELLRVVGRAAASR